MQGYILKQLLKTVDLFTVATQSTFWTLVVVHFFNAFVLFSASLVALDESVWEMKKLKKKKSCKTLSLTHSLSFTLTYQAHIVCQYAPPDPLRPVLGREAGEGVVVECSPLFPKGWECGAVLAGTHPGQSLLLVRQERRAHQLKKQI